MKRAALAKAILMMVLFLGALSTGCTTLVRASCNPTFPVRSGAGGDYNHQSDPGVFSYSVSGDMNVTRLHLIFEQTEGSISWSFSDPTGEVRWQGTHPDTGGFDEMREFKPLEGEWKLTVDYSEGSGSYDHCWMAKSH